MHERLRVKGRVSCEHERVQVTDRESWHTGCVYVYIYVCMYICTYMCIYTYIYTHMHERLRGKGRVS